MCECYISLKLFSILVILLKILGAAMHLSATATPNWLKDANVTVGLFQACTGKDCTDFSDFVSNAGKLDLDFSGDIEASKILALFAVIISFGSLFLSVAEVLLDHVAKRFYKVRIIVPIFSLCLAVLSFLFIAVCAGMMGTTTINNMDMKVQDLQESFHEFQVGFSLILSVCGGVLIALGGLLSAIREKRSRAFKERKNKTRMANYNESTAPTYVEQDTSSGIDVMTSTIGQISEAAIYDNRPSSQKDKDKSNKSPNVESSTDQIEFHEVKPYWQVDASK